MAPTGSVLVLVVEDEFLIANDLRRILEKAGFRVLEPADSVAAAQARVAEQAPDIVLLDIYLRGSQTGLDLAPWLRERNIPFVFLSANLSAGVLEAAKVAEPLGFLNKPFREKDVLSTLEIARYRYAHGQEARLRQQQQIQIAVNNAIITVQDREQLCLAIAAQLDQLVPFTLLNLRIGLPEEESFYWIMLRKTALNTFERIALPALLGADAPQELLARLNREAPDQLGEQTGLFSGPAFDELCRHYPTARASRDTFGVRSMALFPVLLKQRSFTSLQLATTAPEGFGPADYAAVNLVLPQIALALDNLLVCEEVDARRRLKTAELAAISAFQRGHDLRRILPALAQALQALLPLDLLTLYGVGAAPGTAPQGLSVTRQPDGRYQLLRPDDIADFSNPIFRQQWQQALAELERLIQQPTLNVGEAGQARRAQNLVTRCFGQRLGLQSSLYLPVPVPEHPVVALVLASRAPYAYTAKDLHQLQELSGPLGLALENLLSFERIKALSEQLEQEKIYLSEEIRSSHNFEEIVGTSPALQAVFNHIGQVAPTDTTVLILGETGTGKELVARAVHNLSRRRTRTMIKVNCAALPAQLIESELFGHEKGSYTGATDRRIGKFELAQGSTIFLDEIGELPLELQAKLLRVLQEREIERLGGRGPIAVDVRVVAATNRNLRAEVEAGRFRADLYYRLNVFPVLVPPLRERPEDIRPLATHFLGKLSKQLGKPFTGIAGATLQQLQHYAWPGNVRELEYVLERAAILATPPTLTLAEPLAGAPAPLSPPPRPAGVRPMAESMREAILAALAQSAGRIRGAGGAAELLGLKPTTLEARMKKLAIVPPR